MQTLLAKITNYDGFHYVIKSCDNSVGIALGYGLDDRGSKVRFPAVAGNFSLHRVQSGSGAHPGTRGSLPGVKRPGHEAHYSPPSSAELKECVELYFHSPNTPAWRGAQFKKKHRDNFHYYTFLPPPVISYLLCPNFLLSTPYSNTLNFLILLK
jgi:hypothetical protein